MFPQQLLKRLHWLRGVQTHLIIWSRILSYPLRFLPGNSKVFGPPRKLHYSPNDTPHCIVTKLSVEHVISQQPPITNSQLVATAFQTLLNPTVVATYVATFTNGRYFGTGGGAVVSQDDGLVWTLSPTNYTFDMPLHHAFSRILLTPPRKYKKVIHLATRLAKLNYWHWMMDCVPRCRLLAAGEINANDTLDAMWIIDHSHLPFQLETLKALGIKEDSVLIPERYLHIEAETLIVPSYTNPTTETATVTYSRHDLDFLRKIFFRQTIPDARHRMERVYLSRRGSRSITNEQEMISFLQKEGFSVLHCQDLPVWRQAQIFSAAKIVIGLHGAALTNILFCKPGTTVIELLSPEYITPYYSRLSNLAQLRHAVYCEDAYFRGVVGYRFRNKMPVTLNVKAFERFFHKVTSLAKCLN
jgi:capsular polysaccharide biosynthesis protein